MGLDKYLLSVIGFLVIIVAGTLIVADINSNYDDVNINITEYTGNITTIANNNQIFDNSEDMQGHVLGGEVEDVNTVDSIFTGGYSAVRLLTAPLSISNQIIQQVGLSLGIPNIFLKYAFAALVGSIIFLIIFLVFRVKA